MGYDWSKGMSNRAVGAYEAGEMPASKLAAAIRRAAPRGDVLKKCTTADVREALCRSSWHHTSKKYNGTDFYRQPDEEELEALRTAVVERFRSMLPGSQWACPDCGRLYDRPGRCYKCRDIAEKQGHLKLEGNHDQTR